MKTVSLLCALTLACVSFLDAQTPTLEWDMRYNGPASGNDIPSGVAVDSAGNVAVTGYSSGTGTDNDFYTAKYTAANGLLLWEKRYNGPGNGSDRANCVAVDSAGNVVVAGYSVGASASLDFYTAKYAAADGSLLWEKRYDGSSVDIAISVAVDSADNVIVTGYSAGPENNYDYYTAKYAAADGALLWEKRYNGPSNDFDSPTNVAVDSADNVIVTGFSVGVAPYTNYYTAKYAAADGALIWEKRYDSGSGSSKAYSLAVDSTGNVIVTGSSGNGSNEDYYTVKYAAADGTVLWEKRYNGFGNGSDVATGVAVDNGGNVAVTGRSFGKNNDYYTAKYAAADGALLWETRYNGPGNGEDSGTSVATDSAGNVVVTGYSVSTSYDYYTAKYAAADGHFIWQARYNGPNEAADLMNGIGLRYLALTPDGYTVVTGQSSNGTIFDYATVRYGGADLTTLPPILTAPATGTLTKSPVSVAFTLPEAAAAGTVRLTFSGAMTTVLTLANSQGTKGTHAFSFNPANPKANAEIASGSAIEDGTYTVTLSYQDVLTNPVGAASSGNVTIDTTLPNTTINSGPSGSVINSAATFEFSSNEPGSTFLASVDGGAAIAISSPKTYAGLATGSHTFSVRAIDAAGNADPTPAIRTWIVLPPNTTIDSGPSAVLNSSVVTFEFSSNEPNTTFLASLDGGAAVAVTNPHTYTDLTAGPHTFSVRAVDVAGNADPTPATRMWTTLFDPAHEARRVRDSAVPGAGTGEIPAGAMWSDFGVPALNNAGAVAFRGRWNSPAGAGAGIFVDDKLVATTGGSTTTLGPATFATFGDPVLDAVGHVAFLATVEGNGVTAARDTVLVTDAFGVLEVVAREGAATAGVGSPKLKTFKSVSLVDGEVLFTARLQGGSPAATSANDFAGYRVASPGNLMHVVREGDPLGATTVKSFNLLTAVAGSPGQNRGHAAGAATFLALLADGTQALVASSGGTLTKLVATGDTTGAVTLPAATFKSFHVPAADGSRLAFVATLNPGVDGVTTANAQGIFKGEVAGIEPVARIGQATGVGATTFGALQNPVLAPGTDSVAFPATLRGTNSARNASLWWQPAGAPLELLAREGAQPPGVAAGAKWAAFPSLALPGVTDVVGAPRGPLFLATLLLGAGGVDGTNNSGVWAVDTSGALRLLFRKGDLVMGKQVKNFTVLNAVSGSPGVTRAFNDNGQVAWRAAFTDGSTAIVVTQVP